MEQLVHQDKEDSANTRDHEVGRLTTTSPLSCLPGRTSGKWRMETGRLEGAPERKIGWYMKWEIVAGRRMELAYGV